MQRWVDCPDRLTPFPWVGQEFVEPCNQTDLDYYKRRPGKYPFGVSDWQKRRDSIEEQVPMTCICIHDNDTCHGCCPWWVSSFDDDGASVTLETVNFGIVA